MTLSPVPVESFGGLDLISDPGTVGWSGAIDMCDVEFDHPGILRSRDLFSTFATTTLTAPNVVGWGTTGYIVSTAAAVHLYNGGSLVGTAVAPCQYYTGTVQPIGTASASYLYMADLANTQAVRRLTTAGVISAPAGMPVCAYLGRTSSDNRLVAANITTIPTGASSTASGSLVHFSDAGAPETWGANNWVLLDPGDGESITGMTTWNNELYVFKQTKFFIFGPTSTDGTGNPIFNYRAVRGVTGASSLPPIAAQDGVYFQGVNAKQQLSVFRTRGDIPEEIGRPISPALLDATVPDYFTPGGLSLVWDICYAMGKVRLLVSDLTPTKSYIFSFDPETNGWTLAQVPAGTRSITGYGLGNDYFVVAGLGANAKVHYLDLANTTTDTLRTPTPLYRSGFSDLGTPDEKRVHSWRVSGSGSPTLTLSTDFGSLETGAALTLGTSPAVAEAVRRYAPRGRRFSYQVSGTTAWSVNSLTAYVAGKRKPGEHTT